MSRCLSLQVRFFAEWNGQGQTRAPRLKKGPMNATEPLSDGALALLAWYVAMGADEAVGEAPADWARLTLKPQAQSSPATTGVPEGPTAGGGRASMLPAPSKGTQPARSIPNEPPADDGPPPSYPHDGDEFDAPPPRPAVHFGRPQPSTGASPTRTPAPAGDEAVMAAREQARSAASLDDLRALLEKFEGCGLKATAKSLCFYRGAAKARVMVIGEAPGRDEDLVGQPFVGKAGQLLDKMLAAIGLDEASVHITNVVYWRPPGNRTPTPQEAQICHPFLERQIELVAPDVLLCVGGAAAKQVLDTQEGIMRLRGKWREVPSGDRVLRAMATLHPAYLLRTPAAKRMAWRDLMLVKVALDGVALDEKN
jgi:uracil-DNA glycosylase